MNFDITTLERSREVQHRIIIGYTKIEHEDAEPTAGDPVGFIVVGPASEQYQAIDREIQRLNIMEAGRHQGRQLNLRSEEDAGVVVDKSADRRLRIVKACTVGWFGFTNVGQPAVFTAEGLALVLKARPQWVGRVLAEIENEQNFIAAALPA